MQVHVSLLGALRDRLPPANRGQTTLTVPNGTTVAALIQQLQLATSTAAAIAGQQVDKSYILQPEDHLQLFRQLGGG